MEPLTDREAVERIATDYIDSWFAGDGERMRASLHPGLAKRAVDGVDGDPLRLDETSAAEMASAAAAGRGTAHPRGHHVEVLDLDGNLASVKVTSTPYVEYLHLARFGSRWLIVNVVWRRRAGGAG